MESNTFKGFFDRKLVPLDSPRFFFSFFVRRGNQAGRRDGRIEGSPFSERTNSCSGSIWLPSGWGSDAQLKKRANIWVVLGCWRCVTWMLQEFSRWLGNGLWPILTYKWLVNRLYPTYTWDILGWYPIYKPSILTSWDIQVSPLPVIYSWST